MRFLSFKPKIFERFPQLRTFFVVGNFNIQVSGKEKVIEERKLFLKHGGFKPSQFATVQQIHSAIVKYITPNRWWNFLSQRSPQADALVTDYPEIFLAVRSADCLPILLYNKKAKIIGAIHAGWEGSAKNIARRTVEFAVQKFGASIKDFYFFFGPSARSCCYEITQRPERAVFFKEYPEVVVKRKGKIYLDFVRVNFLKLKEIGVKESQIEDCGICTIHNPEFPSHRREREKRSETIMSVIGRNSY